MFGEHSGAVFLKVLFHKKTSFQEHPTHSSLVWAGAPSLTEGAPSHKGSDAWGSLPASQPKPPLRTFATGDPSGARPHWLRASARGRPTRTPTRRPPAPPPPPRSVAAPPIPPTPLLFFFFLFTAGRCFPLGKNFPSRLSGRAPTPRGTAPRGSPAPSSVLPSARSPLFHHHTPLTHGAAPKPPPLPPPFPRLLTCGRARRSQRAQPAAPMPPGGFAAGGRLPGTAPGPLRQRPAEAHGSPRRPAAPQP